MDDALKKSMTAVHLRLLIRDTQMLVFAVFAIILNFRQARSLHSPRCVAEVQWLWKLTSENQLSRS